MPVDAPLFDIPFGTPPDINTSRAMLVNAHNVLEAVRKTLRDHAAECLEECAISVTECRRCLMAAAAKPIENVAGKLQKTRAALYQSAMEQLSSIGEMVSSSRPFHGNPLGDTVSGSLGVGPDRAILSPPVPIVADVSGTGGISDGVVVGSGGSYEVYSFLPPGSVIRTCNIYEMGSVVNPPRDAYDGQLIGTRLTLREASALQARCPAPPRRAGGSGGRQPPLRGPFQPSGQSGSLQSASGQSVNAGIGQAGQPAASSGSLAGDMRPKPVYGTPPAPPLRDAGGLAVAGQLGGVNRQTAMEELQRVGLTVGQIAGMPANDARRLLINAGVGDLWTNFIINVVQPPFPPIPIGPPLPPLPPPPPPPPYGTVAVGGDTACEPCDPPVVCPDPTVCDPAIDLYDVYKSPDDECYCVLSGVQPNEIDDTLLASGITAGACPQIIQLACGDDSGCKRFRQCDPPSLSWAGVQTWNAGIEGSTYRKDAAAYMGSSYAAIASFKSADDAAAYLRKKMGTADYVQGGGLSYEQPEY